ncbi:MAG: hypothetical protein ACREQL_14970, partial [Candidatus Binatia bacterium]
AEDRIDLRSIPDVDEVGSDTPGDSDARPEADLAARRADGARLDADLWAEQHAGDAENRVLGKRRLDRRGSEAGGFSDDGDERQR